MYLVDLFRHRILTVRGLARLLMHVAGNGVQLGNVVHMGDKHVTALRHRDQALTYDEFLKASSSVSGYLHKQYASKQGSTVLVIVDNSIPSVVLLFALSALGCNIHIFPPVRDYNQFRQRLSNSPRYDFIFAGTEVPQEYYHNAGVRFLTPVWEVAIKHKPYRPFIWRMTTISIFTSGTTGVSKKAQRRNTLWPFLKVIADIGETLKFSEYTNVFLPVPISHSYGLSTLFLALMMNRTVTLSNKFDQKEVAATMRRDKIQVAVLIPQMINRLLGDELPKLGCIVSCADVLPVQVLTSAREKFGDIIFNLYGTSETGLATIATPQMLAVKPTTIGRPIKGCDLRLVEETGKQVLYVKSGFAAGSGFLRTGDIASVDERGWYYVHGRSDDMIIANGLNIYPDELVQMASRHDKVQYAAVRGFVNPDGFRRIRIVLCPKSGQVLDEIEFREWWINQYGTQYLPSVVEFRTDVGNGKLMD